MMGKDEMDAYDIWGSDTELDDWNMPAVTMTLWAAATLK